MPVFNDSESLRKEYQKLGEIYQPTEYDLHYKAKLREIEADPNRREIITAINRIRVSEDEEYITYTHAWEGTNPIGSYVKVTQTDVGVYPEFRPVKERYITPDNTYADRILSKNPRIAYDIPFSKEKADELHKLCNDKTARDRTKYYIETDGGTKITVDSFKDWRDGTFDELEEFGHIPTDDEIVEKDVVDQHEQKQELNQTIGKKLRH